MHHGFGGAIFHAQGPGDNVHLPPRIQKAFDQIIRPFGIGVAAGGKVWVMTSRRMSGNGRGKYFRASDFLPDAAVDVIGVAQDDLGDRPGDLVHGVVIRHPARAPFLELRRRHFHRCRMRPGSRPLRITAPSSMPRALVRLADRDGRETEQGGFLGNGAAVRKVQKASFCRAT